LEAVQRAVVHVLSTCLAAELEFAQIIIIVVVVTVMVVVIVCLLNHYKVSTRSFINRPSQSRRQEDPLQPVSVAWASLSTARPLSWVPIVRQA
jgi:Flp pilus assembly protein CpaB